MSLNLFKDFKFYDFYFFFTTKSAAINKILFILN